MKSLLLCAALTLASGITASAQPAPPPGHERMMNPERAQQMMLEMVSRELKLDPGQKQKMQRIFEGLRASAVPLQEQMQKVRNEIKEAVVAGKSDEEVNALTQKAGSVYVNLLAAHNRAFRQGFELLNDSQKKQADLLYDSLGMAQAGGSRGRPMMPAPPVPREGTGTPDTK